MAFFMLTFYTEIQQGIIEHIYCAGLRLIYNLNMRDDLTVDILTKEFTLHNYLYKYWIKFSQQLEIFAEAHHYQLPFISYLTAKSPQKNWYLNMGLRTNNKFLNRLSQRA
jgi:hypothetical protein